MHPHFSRVFPLNGVIRFFICEKLILDSLLIFVLFLKEKQNKKKLTLSMTPTKKKQVCEKQSLGPRVTLPIRKVR